MIKSLLLSSIHLFLVGTNHQIAINKFWKKLKLSDMLHIHLFLSSWALATHVSWQEVDVESIPTIQVETIVLLFVCMHIMVSLETNWVIWK